MLENAGSMIFFITSIVSRDCQKPLLPRFRDAVEALKSWQRLGMILRSELPLGGAWSGPIGGTGRLIPLIFGRDGAREGQRVTNNNTRPADNWP